MNLRRFGGLCFAFLPIVACGPEQDGGEGVYNLPSELTEISGLAAAGPDSVFTHDDEYAIIYEFRLSDGKILRAFALGEPTIEGDFEGIATWVGQVFLVTSDGLIYAAQPGANGERISYRVHDSGIGPRCEVEGLSQSPLPDELLLLCKRFRNGSEQARLEIHRWHVGSDRAEDEPFLSLPLETLFEENELAEFRPSGIEWDVEAGEVLVVSAPDRMMLAFDRRGHLVSRHRLDRSRHPKVEGIAVLPGRRLVLADEGSTTRGGRISAYRFP
jgi:uncharacterized protein YjiK